MKDKRGKVIRDTAGNPKPLFNGKNPSYTRADGTPKLISWKKYAQKNPTDAELKEWFQNDTVGVGTVPTNGYCFIDLDRKNFDSDKTCKNALARILEGVPRTYHEATPSGGFHIAVKLTDSPNTFVNFALEGLGHCGELRYNGKGFIALAGTPGYKSLNGDEICPITSVQELGISATTPETDTPLNQAKTSPEGKTKAKEPKPRPSFRQLENPDNVTVALIKVISRKTKDLYKGIIPSGSDASQLMTGFIKEVWGWQNFCQDRGIKTDSPNHYINQVTANLGIPKERLERIQTKIKKSYCKPALQSRAARDKSGTERCIHKITWLITPDNSVTNLKKTDDIEVGDDTTPGLFCWDYLYSKENWISVNGDVRTFQGVYRFNGTHYEAADPGKERNRITELLTKAVQVKKDSDGMPTGEIKRVWAHSHSIANAIGYVFGRIPAIAPDEINLGGLNCTNGFLRIEWEEKKLKLNLEPHSPQQLCTIAPGCQYNPKANPAHAERLLEAIEPDRRSIVLRTMAASFDLPTVRKFGGRAVKGLFLVGDGSNGKDTLRTVLEGITGGDGMTSVGMQSFEQYDQGRYFGLVPLLHSRMNWPSENALARTIDRLESLKAVITGDSLTYEPKFGNATKFSPKCVCIFNANPDFIKIIGSSEAIQSRYAIVSMDKVFKPKHKFNPQDPRQVIGDPRFKEHPEWLKAEVCPAMLNILLAELQALINEGIDYAPVEATMEAHAMESFHLKRFFNEYGYTESIEPTDEVPVAEVWKDLRGWYINEEMLEPDPDGDTRKDKFADDPRPGDKIVKSPSHVTQRLKPFFKNLKAIKSKGIRILKGIRKMSQEEIEAKQQKEEEKHEIAHTPQTAKEEKEPTKLTPTSPEVIELMGIRSAEEYERQEHKLGQRLQEAWSLLTPEAQRRIAHMVETAHKTYRH